MPIYTKHIITPAGNNTDKNKSGQTGKTDGLQKNNNY